MHTPSSFEPDGSMPGMFMALHRAGFDTPAGVLPWVYDVQSLLDAGFGNDEILDVVCAMPYRTLSRLVTLLRAEFVSPPDQEGATLHDLTVATLCEVCRRALVQYRIMVESSKAFEDWRSNQVDTTTPDM